VNPPVALCNCSLLGFSPRFGKELIQGPSGVDESDVGMRGWEISKMLATRPQLFRVEAEMVGITEGLFKNKARLLQIARLRQGFHIPE
jgi:hypothetical protein